MIAWSLRLQLGNPADATPWQIVFAAFSGAKTISGALQVARRDLAARGMEPRVHIGPVSNLNSTGACTEAGSAAWRALASATGVYFG